MTKMTKARWIMIDLLVKIGGTMMLSGCLLGVGLAVIENIFPWKEPPEALIWVTLALIAVPPIVYLYGALWLS